LRNDYLTFALPDVDDAELEQIKEALDSGWVTTGPKTRQFEAEFARSAGAKHAIAVNSCTAALHLALEAIGLAQGEEVLIPATTFASTAEVVRYFNARPVIVDVEPDTLCLNPALAKEAITERTRAIIPVHLAGLMADMVKLRAIADAHGLSVIEDAAHSVPTVYRERPENSLGDFVCYSFYATKTLTTGEGGMICTENDSWAERCRIMSLHGISRDAWKRYTNEGSWYYEIIAPGFKYNMTDIAAAMGLAQLRKVERMWQRRKEISERYTAEFQELPELQTPERHSSNGNHAWHLYILRLNLSRLKIDRDRFIDELKAQNIGTSVHFIPLHLHPYYRRNYGYKPEDMPVAYEEYQRVISLPIYSRMSDQDVSDVVAAVKETIARHRVRNYTGAQVD